MINKNKIIIAGIITLTVGIYIYNSIEKKDKTIIELSDTIGKDTFQFAKQLTINQSNYMSVFTVLLKREILLKYNTSIHIKYITNYIQEILKNNKEVDFTKYSEIQQTENKYKLNIGSFLYPLFEELVKKYNIKFVRK